MTRWLLGLMIAAQLFAIAIAIHYQRAMQRQIDLRNNIEQARHSPCGIIHMPEAGQCPVGYGEVADTFEYRGQHLPACVNPLRRHCVDILRAGEQFGVTIKIPMDQMELRRKESPLRPN